VIYTGLHQTPEMIVEAALQEDVDVISLSILSGAHLTLFSRVLELLKENAGEDILVIGGGIIPEEDAAALRKMGVAAIFGPGTPTTEPIRFLREYFERKRDPAADPEESWLPVWILIPFGSRTAGTESRKPRDRPGVVARRGCSPAPLFRTVDPGRPNSNLLLQRRRDWVGGIPWR